MKRTEYICDLCRTTFETTPRIPGGVPAEQALIGVWLVGGKQGWEPRPIAQVERHLCRDCIRGAKAVSVE